MKLNMSMHETSPFQSLVIDEGFLEGAGISFLTVSVFDEEGKILFYTEFERDTGPKEISGFLEFAADEILDDPPKDMPESEVIKISEAIYLEAKRILRD